jgi:N-acetyl-gamma-glutamyl-phosphate reductase
MIAQYESPAAQSQEMASRPKNLNLAHKHLPEMQKYGLLDLPPLFTPIVGNFYQGMLVFVPLYLQYLSKEASALTIRQCLQSWYAGERFISVIPKEQTERIGDGFLSPTALNGTNNLEIFIFARNDHLLLVSRFDNLGKGASGAAVQNLNLLINAPEDRGL